MMINLRTRLVGKNLDKYLRPGEPLRAEKFGSHNNDVISGKIKLTLYNLVQNVALERLDVTKSKGDGA